MQSYDALFQWQYILGKCQTAPSPKSNLFKYFSSAIDVHHSTCIKNVAHKTFFLCLLYLALITNPCFGQIKKKKFMKYFSRKIYQFILHKTKNNFNNFFSLSKPYTVCNVPFPIFTFFNFLGVSIINWI